MDLKGSKTEKNLYKTYAGECRARTKYNLYSEKAKSEGFIWISEVFNQISGNEYAHAREAYKRYLEKICDTESNLIDSALGEAEESEFIYKEFEKVAREEGFDEIAHFYKELQEVEFTHKEMFLKLAKEMKENKTFKCDKECYFKCLNCGYIYEGDEAPEKCPLCKYPKSYFEKLEYIDCK